MASIDEVFNFEGEMGEMVKWRSHDSSADPLKLEYDAVTQVSLTYCGHFFSSVCE